MSTLAEQLKAWLRRHRDRSGYKQHFPGRDGEMWTEQVQGGGGCPTCGYGADEYEAVDWEKLDAEIDAFCATFKGE